MNVASPVRKSEAMVSNLQDDTAIVEEEIVLFQRLQEQGRYLLVVYMPASD